MFHIKTLNKISNVGISKFDTEKYTCGDNVENPQAIMVRSASMHEMEMPQIIKLSDMRTKRRRGPVSEASI